MEYSIEDVNTSGIRNRTEEAELAHRGRNSRAFVVLLTRVAIQRNFTT